MEKAYSDLASYTQDNLDAFVRYNTAVTKGVEQMSKNLFALATHALEETAEAGKRLATAKSIGEAFELQSRFAQESIETLFTEMKKVQDISTSMAKDATAPLAERFKATVSGIAGAAQSAASAAQSSVSTAPSSKKAA